MREKRTPLGVTRTAHMYAGPTLAPIGDGGRCVEARDCVRRAVIHRHLVMYVQGRDHPCTFQIRECSVRPRAVPGERVRVVPTRPRTAAGVAHGGAVRGRGAAGTAAIGKPRASGAERSVDYVFVHVRSASERLRLPSAVTTRSSARLRCGAFGRSFVHAHVRRLGVVRSAREQRPEPSPPRLRSATYANPLRSAQGSASRGRDSPPPRTSPFAGYSRPRCIPRGVRTRTTAGRGPTTPRRSP